MGGAGIFIVGHAPRDTSRFVLLSAGDRLFSLLQRSSAPKKSLLLEAHTETMALLPVLILLLFSVCQRSQPVQGLTAVSHFSQNGLSGTITFYQPTPSSNTTITLNLTQLPLENLPWHVHVFPFRLGSPSPCSSSNVAGHFDPLLASAETDYSARCAGNSSLCEMGDLSGKHGVLTTSNSVQQFSDSTLHLHGVYSIIGRSVVIHRPDNTRLACANIEYPDVAGFTRNILYSPFRSTVSGDVYIQQYSSNMTSVFTDLLLLTSVSSSSNHNWHVHTDQVLPEESCSAAMGHYNPQGVLTTGNYTQLCTPTMQRNCEVGDLSGKGGTLDFSQQQNKLFYTDTDLPIEPQAGISILNRSIVVHGENRAAERIACANLRYFKGREAISRFTGNQGVSGFIRFFQRTPFDQTVVTIYLTGLNMQASGYHVHVYPVGESNQCSSPYTGGHFNPRNVDYSLTNPPVTSDQYEIGDLSGKFGALDEFDSINLTKSDSNIPLYGMDSIIGRSIVIHRRDGSRWACANIEHTAPVQQVSTVFTIGSRAVRMVLTQPTDDPFAETTIFIANLPPRQPSTTLSLTSSAVADIASSTPVVSTPVATSSTSSSLALDSTTMMTSSTEATSPSVTPFSSSVTQSAVSSTIAISTTPNQPTTSLSTTPGLATTSLSTTPDLTTTPVTTTQALTTTPLSTTPNVTTSPGLATTSLSSLVASQNLSTTSVPPMSSMQQLSSTAVISTSSIITSSASLNFSTSSLFVSSPPLTTSSIVPTTMTTDQISTTSITTTDVFVTVSDTIQPSSLSMSSSISLEESPDSSYLDSFEESSFLELAPAASPTPVTSTTTPTPGGMKKRAVAEDQDYRRAYNDLVKRQTGSSTDLEWSVRQLPATAGSTDCAALGVFSPGPDSTSLCQSGEQLACTAGDLTSKHGSITVDSQDGVRLVFTDPSLPLSGPNSVANMVLLLQSADRGDSVYAMIQQGPDAQDTQADVTCSRPDTSSPVISSTPGVAPAGLQLPVVIGICVGIVIVLILLIVFVILLAVYITMKKRSTKQNYSLPEMNGKNYSLEMGKFTPSKPIIGVVTYRALHHYKPQHEGDMMLEEGDLVELIETPYGGEWWKGKVQERKGWFPKDYVEYVDLEAEQKKKKEEEFQVAAAMIKAASYTFSRDTKAKDATTPTVRRMTIDSTPRLVTKFEVNNQDGSIDNLSKDGVLLVGSRPDTPSSLKIENTSTVGESPVPDTDMCIAKYDYTATAETELDFKQGEYVVVLERADNGWWHGLIGERHGWFPESFAEPVTSNTQDDATQQTPQDEPAGLGPRRMSEFVAGTSEEVEASEFKAIQTYDGGEEEDSIKFSEGDMVLVYWAHDNGWWYGAAGSNQGWFPGSYVEPIMESSEHSLATSSPTLPIVEEKEEPYSLGDEIAAVLAKKDNRGTEEEQSTALQDTSEPPLSLSSPGEGGLQSEIQSILGRLNSKSTLRKTSPDQKLLLETEQSSSVTEEPKSAPSQPDKPVEREPSPSVEKKDSVSTDTQGSLQPSSDNDRSLTPTQNKQRRRAPPPPRPVVKASSISSRSRSPKPHRVAPPTPPNKSPIPHLTPSPQPSAPKAAIPSPLANSPAFLLPSPPVSKDSPTPPPSSPIVKVETSQTVSPQPASPVPVGTPPIPHLKPVRLTTAESRTKKRRPPPTPPGLKKDKMNQINKLSLSKEEVDGSPAPNRPPPLAPVPAPRQRPPKPKARVQMIKRPQTRNIPPPPAIPLPPPPKRQIPPPPSMKPPQLPPEQAKRQSPPNTRHLETTEKVDLQTAPSDDKPASSPKVAQDVSSLEASKPPPVKPKPTIKPKPAVLPKPKRFSQALPNKSPSDTQSGSKPKRFSLNNPPTSPLESLSGSRKSLSGSRKSLSGSRKTLPETTVITNTAALDTMRQSSEPSDDSSSHPVPAKRTITNKPTAPRRKSSLENKLEETSNQVDDPLPPKQQPPRPKPPSFDNEETDGGTKVNKVAKPARPSNPPPVPANRSSKPPAQPEPAAKQQKPSEDKASKPSARRLPPARPPPPKLHSSSQAKQQPSVSSSSSKFYKATQSYQSTESGHLEFNSGDVLVFIDKETDKEGYLYGMTDDGTTGLFPLSYVKLFEAPK